MIVQRTTLRWPDWLQKLVDNADNKYPSDRKKAVEWLFTQVTQHEEYETIVNDLIKNCLQELIYDARHKRDTAMKYDEGYYRSKPNTTYGTAADPVYKMIYEYRINGTTLGDVIVGEESMSIAAKERAIANGHMFNVKLMDWITQNGREGEAVRDCIPEKKLRARFKAIWKEYRKEEELTA